jgi:hypothetical protein
MVLCTLKYLIWFGFCVVGGWGWGRQRTHFFLAKKENSDPKFFKWRRVLTWLLVDWWQNDYVDTMCFLIL